MPQNTTGQLPIWLERLRNISAEGSPNELMSQSLLYETFTNLARLLAQHTAKGSPNELMPKSSLLIYNIKKPLQFLVAACAATRPPGARRWYDVCFRNRAAPLRTSISILSRNV